MRTNLSKQLLRFFSPELGQTPAATLCQSPHTIQNNLLQVAANAITSLADLPLW